MDNGTNNKGGNMQAISSDIVYLTEAQVSKITGRAQATLQKDRYRRVGIPYIRIGRHIRYTLQDVHAYMAANRVETNN